MNRGPITFKEFFKCHSFSFWVIELNNFRSIYLEAQDAPALVLCAIALKHLFSFTAAAFFILVQIYCVGSVGLPVPR